MKFKILLIGKNIIHDKLLSHSLQKLAHIYSLDSINQLQAYIQNEAVNLVIFEFTDQWKNELELLKQVKELKLQIPIIMINGADSMEATILSFQCCVKDVFKTPYKIELLSERVEALLTKRKKTI